MGTRLVVLVASLLLASAAPPAVAQDGELRVEQVRPADRPSIVLLVTNTGAARIEGALQIVVTEADAPGKRVFAHDEALRLQAGTSREIRLGPFDRPYGGLDARVHWNGTVQVHRVFAGTLDAAAPFPLRVAEFQAFEGEPRQAPAAGPGPAPVKPGGPWNGTAPPFPDGTPASDEAVLFIAHTTAPARAAVFHIAWLDAAGDEVGTASRTPVTLPSEPSPVGPSRVVPAGAVRVATELVFDGGAVRSTIIDIPSEWEPERFEGPSSDGLPWAAVVLAFVVVLAGAAVALWAGRRV